MTKDNDNYFQTQGTVLTALGNSMFSVLLIKENKSIICTISGKISRNNIRIAKGDLVTVDVSTYDPSKGRISYRFNKK